MAVRLHPATRDALVTVLAWTPEAAELAQWAGPVRFPPTPETFWEDSFSAPGASFVLRGEEEAVLAFGQIFARAERTVHLARLVVAPASRGRGHGRELCRQLMAEARARHAPERFTLNVLAANLPALRLYESLGFTAETRDEAKGTIGMARPAGEAS